MIRWALVLLVLVAAGLFTAETVSAGVFCRGGRCGLWGWPLLSRVQARRQANAGDGGAATGAAACTGGACQVSNLSRVTPPPPVGRQPAIPGGQ